MLNLEGIPKFRLSLLLAALAFSATETATATPAYLATPLPTLGVSSAASGINNAGQAVGASYTAGNTAWHATRWSGGVATDLGTLGGSRSAAYGINDAGQVVGGSYTAGDAAWRATLWSGGVAVDLNTFLSPADQAAGWVFDDVTLGAAINDSGAIALNAHNYDTHEERAYLLTPTASVPEPAQLLLVLTSLAGLLAARRRRPAVSNVPRKQARGTLVGRTDCIRRSPPFRLEY